MFQYNKVSLAHDTITHRIVLIIIGIPYDLSALIILATGPCRLLKKELTLG